MTASGFEFRRASKTYGTLAAVSDLSILLSAGTHTAILGPSGCGKTTALRLLAGLDVPTAGEVLMDGQVISDRRGIHLPPHRRHLSMVFQDLALWPNLTAAQNVALGLSGLGLGRRKVRSRTQAALDMCGIGELAGRRPGELSGGQQQRVALARAVAPRPAFMLLDEPFGGLDLVLKSRLIEELAALASDTRITLILVTHDPMEATAVCQRAVLLDQGRLEEEGNLKELVQTSQAELFRLFRQYAAKPESGTAPALGRAPDLQ